MSDPDPNQPTHKMVDGVLVELTQAEIDAIMQERRDALKREEPPPEPEKPHAQRRSK